MLLLLKSVSLVTNHIHCILALIVIEFFQLHILIYYQYSKWVSIYLFQIDWNGIMVENLIPGTTMTKVSAYILNDYYTNITVNSYILLL